MLGFLRNSIVSAATLTLLVIPALTAYAQTKGNKSEQSYQQSIGEIGRKISVISRNLNANKTLLKTERDQLFKVEREISDISRRIEQTNYELAKNEHELDALAVRIKRLYQAQEINRSALGRLLTSRYQYGKPDYLKKLLSQENPYAVGRLTNYNNYFSTALKEKYSELSRLAEEALALKETQSAVVDRLNKDRNTQKALKEKQENNKKMRTATIASLDTKVANSAKELETLTKDRERLRSLLTQLKKQAAELKRLEQQRVKARAAEQAKQNKRNRQNKPSSPPRRALVKGGFVKQKGRLLFPVSGTATRKYGVRLPESGMRAEGHFFSTKGSVSVKSIFRGRVLFADFLKGYGQLIIIDHGDDHISLYGHNDKVLKRVGDTVETNEVIAKSGVTGGLKSPGLYFEIRNNATPVDPAKWCR